MSAQTKFKRPRFSVRQSDRNILQLKWRSLTLFGFVWPELNGYTLRTFLELYSPRNLLDSVQCPQHSPLLLQALPFLPHPALFSIYMSHHQLFIGFIIIRKKRKEKHQSQNILNVECNHTVIMIMITLIIIILTLFKTQYTRYVVE